MAYQNSEIGIFAVIGLKKRYSKARVLLKEIIEVSKSNDTVE